MADWKVEKEELRAEWGFWYRPSIADNTYDFLAWSNGFHVYASDERPDSYCFFKAFKVPSSFGLRELMAELSFLNIEMDDDAVEAMDIIDSIPGISDLVSLEYLEHPIVAEEGSRGMFDAVTSGRVDFGEICDFAKRQNRLSSYSERLEMRARIEFADALANPNGLSYEEAGDLKDNCSGYPYDYYDVVMRLLDVDAALAKGERALAAQASEIVKASSLLERAANVTTKQELADFKRHIKSIAKEATGGGFYSTRELLDNIFGLVFSWDLFCRVNDLEPTDVCEELELSPESPVLAGPRDIG